MRSVQWLNFIYISFIDWAVFIAVAVLFYSWVRRACAKINPKIRFPWQVNLIVTAWIVLGLLMSFLFAAREEERISGPLLHMAKEYAQQMELLEHSRLNSLTSLDDPGYIKLIEYEKDVLQKNNSLSDIYTLKKNSDNQIAFMVDSETDYDRNGRYEGDTESRTPIGEVFPEASKSIEIAFKGTPAFQSKPYVDRWGVWVSAFVPMKNKSRLVESVLGIDLDATAWLVNVLYQRVIALVGGTLLLLSTFLYTISYVRLRNQLIINSENEHRIREAGNQLTVITNQVPGMVYQYKLFPDGRQIFQYVSQGSVSLLGFRPDELVQDFNLLWEQIMLDDREKLVKSIEESAKKGALWSYEFRVKRKDGEIRWVRGRSAPEKPLADGSIVWNGILLDVTFGRVLTDALSLSEARNRMLFENSLDAVIILDSMGRVINWNAQAAEIFGWKKEEVIGQKLSDLIISMKYQKAFEEGLQCYLETGESYVLGRRMELEGFHRSGRIVPMELSMTSLKSDSGILFGAFIRDLTEKKKMDEDKIKMSQIEFLSEAKSRFIAVFSHEIRTPLNAIMGFSALLKDLELNEVQRDYVDTIYESGELLLSCINSILDFSKLESGQRDLDIQLFDLEASLKLVIKLMQKKGSVQKVGIFLDYAKEITRTFKSDRVVIEQILLNLLGNAKKFTESGRIDVIVERLNENTGDGKVLVIRIKDTGIGISDADLKLLFKPFSQVDDSSTRKKRGTGLGLAITKSLVDLLGGAIEVESKQGVGSEFRVLLPLYVDKKGVVGIGYSSDTKSINK